jgi:hypothetical protein
MRLAGEAPKTMSTWAMPTTVIPVPANEIVRAVQNTANP